MIPSERPIGAEQAMKHFIVETPEYSLPLTGEQARALFEQLGKHLGSGPAPDAARAFPGARTRKTRNSQRP